MRQNLKVENHIDNDGNPAGGVTLGVGIGIVWQNGPLGRGQARNPQNGAFVEGVLQAAVARLKFYQSTKFACEYNQNALDYLNLALEALDMRTRDREKREVEGTHQL